jgi:hypothetical protein
MTRRDAVIRALGLLSALALAACARVTALEGPPQDLQQVYQETIGTPPPAPALQSKALPVGPEGPYTPIMQPPRVQRVWVPDHLNTEGDLVAGHWVYLLLEPSRWFLETYPLAPAPTLRVPLAPPVPPPSSPVPGAPVPPTLRHGKPPGKATP